MVGSRSCVTVWRYPKKPYHQNHDLNTWPRWGQSHALFTRPARIRCGKELYPKHTENMNKLFSIKSTRGSERSTGNVDQVCFWGIATPVTRQRDPKFRERLLCFCICNDRMEFAVCQFRLDPFAWFYQMGRTNHRSVRIERD